MGRAPVPLAKWTKEVYLNQPKSESIFRDEKGNIDLYSEVVGDAEEWSGLELRNFSSAMELIRTCLRVIRADKEILMYQTISVAICVTVLYLFLFGLFPSFDPETVEETMSEPTFAFQLFPYYFIAFLVLTYFNTATVVVATIRMKGGDHTFRDGIEAATRRLLPIFQWAGVSALMGVLLTLIRSDPIWGVVMTWIVGFTWSVATYFVIPVLLFEEEGPITAARRSFAIVRRIWRETLDGNLGLTIVFISFGMLGLTIVLPVGVLLGGPLTMIISIVIFLSLLGIFAAALNSVLVATLYGIARTGEIPNPASMYALMKSAVEALTEDIRPLPAVVDDTKPQVDTKYFNRMRKS